MSQLPVRGHKFFTSESVSGGHSDKVADQISDAILDSCLAAAGATGGAEDPGVRVACETMVRRDTVILAGEIRLPAGVESPDFERSARQAVRDIGYCDGAVDGFDADTFTFSNFLCGQSDEIYDGTTVVKNDPQALGAGDQGMMFGYAVAETKNLMPLPIQASHAILALHDAKRRSGELSWLKPDAKSQVTVEYDDRDKPLNVRKAIFSTQYESGFALADVRIEGEKLVREALGGLLGSLDIELADDLEIQINTAGAFTAGGPASDSGLTGRKLMVDTYGSMGRHGGGAFSGKDPTKVDRSAAYACRHVAKNIVAAGLADECEVQVSYAIGVAEPDISVNHFNTGRHSSEQLTELVRKHFDLRPQGIISNLRLWQPIYRRHCVLGHFGGTDAPWEALDRVDELKAEARR